MQCIVVGKDMQSFSDFLEANSRDFIVSSGGA